MKLWSRTLAGHVLRHPSDAIALARAGWRLRRDGWLREWPFLPLPDARYWHFRVVTANGGAAPTLSVSSMVDAARWSLAQSKIGRK